MHQVYNDDRDIGAGSSGVLEGENRDRSDRPPRKRSPGGIDAAAGEHVRANFSLHRRAGYREESEATDVVATMIFRTWRKARYPCIRSHLDGDDATLAHLPRAKGHRRSWNRVFEKLCVCVCMSLPSLGLLPLGN